MEKMKNFPHLTASEFLTAISSLQRLFHRAQPSSSSSFSPSADSRQTPWISVDIIQDLGTEYLRITKPFPSQLSKPAQPSSDPLISALRGKEKKDEEQIDNCHSSFVDTVEVYGEDDDDDPEALPPRQNAPEPVIYYDIILSSTYSVPVIYFSIKDVAHIYAPTMDVLYEHVIVAHYLEQTKEAGVMGGITIGVSD